MLQERWITLKENKTVFFLFCIYFHSTNPRPVLLDHMQFFGFLECGRYFNKKHIHMQFQSEGEVPAVWLTLHNISCCFYSNACFKIKWVGLFKVNAFFMSMCIIDSISCHKHNPVQYWEFYLSMVIFFTLYVSHSFVCGQEW